MSGSVFNQLIICSLSGLLQNAFVRAEGSTTYQAQERPLFSAIVKMILFPSQDEGLGRFAYVNRIRKEDKKREDAPSFSLFLK